MRQTVAAVAGLALAAGLASGPAAAESGPQAIIEQTVEQVLAILGDTSRDHAARRQDLEAIARERFDFRTMSRLVLARNWKKLSDAQQGEFVSEFTTYLSNDYGNRLDRYQQESVKVLGTQDEPRGDVTVKTKIVGGEQDGALVDYRMRKRKQGWRIIDVVIEGVSLVANFRDQFREVMGNAGPDELLDKLREKNADGATLESRAAHRAA